MSMDSGLVVYDDTGTTVFDKSTRTLKIVKEIPFSRSLRFTTTVYQDPLFLSEDPTWFFTGGTVSNKLIEVSYDNDKMIVKVNTFYKARNNGGLYEDPDAGRLWDRNAGTHIMLAVY